MSLTNPQWEKLWKKYGKLAMFAANRTPSFTSLEIADKLSELKIVMLLAVEGFEKTNKEDGPFDEYFETKKFNAYIKACLWYKRSHLTKEAYRKRAVDGDMISLSAVSDEFVEDISVSSNRAFDSKLFEIEFDDDISELVSEILSDVSYFKLNGKFNISKIARNTNMPTSKVVKMIKRLKTSLAQQMDMEE